jgi:hypothetical protein
MPTQTTMIQIAFTTLVVILIVFPIPPSTIIGVGLATHPKTGKYMNPFVYRMVQPIGWLVTLILVKPVAATAKAISTGRQMSAAARIASGHRLL